MEITHEDINTAISLVDKLGSVWRAPSQNWREVVDGADEKESYDGSGLYCRKGSIIVWQQYGGVLQATFADIDLAAHYMTYIRATSN